MARADLTSVLRAEPSDQTQKQTCARNTLRESAQFSSFEAKLELTSLILNCDIDVLFNPSKYINRKKDSLQKQRHAS